ncbi:Pseudouridine synthase [Naviculisporaceae sp. PSN 640]
MKYAKFFKMATNKKIMEGVFAVNKPVGMSSAQVIRDCQAVFNPSALFAPLLAQEKALRDKESQYQKRRRGRAKRELQVKIGHGGTLDPLACGVLILGVGKGTKSLQNFLLCKKTYETVVVFGASTDTYDRVGRIIKKGNYDGITREQVETALETFRGKFKQMPPLYSSLKMEGKPLYEYAREGKPIPREIETRDVEVTELELTEWYEPGTHNHRWPTEEAEQSEKDLVGSVWQVAKKQAGGEEEPAQLTAEQEKQDTEAKAKADYNSKKREAEERVDDLVRDDVPSKKRKVEAKQEQQNDKGAEPLMSGALGVLPKGRGSDLIPPPPSPDTPFPWEGKGPPAAKIRMTVTSGFYVRSLCHDLGEKLGCGAMMAELCRSKQGEFAIGGDNCLEYSDLLKGEEVWAPKVESMLDLWNGVPPKKRASSPVAEATTAPEAGTTLEAVTAPQAATTSEPATATEPATTPAPPAAPEKAE